MEGVSADIAIIGGGIVGLSSALELMERGRSVVIIDPDEAQGRASFGNAGVLSRGSIFPVAGPNMLGKLPGYALGRDIAVRVRLGALPEFSGWLSRFLRAANEGAWTRAADALNPLVSASLARHLALAERTGASSLIRRNGYLRLYREARALIASGRERAVLSQHGVRFEVIDEAGIRELEPHLAPRFVAGLLFTEAASVESPGELVDAYRAHFIERGGRLISGLAQGLDEEEDSVRLSTSAGPVSASKAVLSAGAWSARFAKELGYRIPLAAERGYHLHLKPRGNAMLNRPVHDAAGAYVMSPMGDTVRVLSGVELARPDDAPDYTQINRVVSQAKKSLPLAYSPDHQVWMGSRPSTPDGLPVIGFPKHHKRLLFAFGHGHIGFANGPITGQLVAQLLSNEAPTVPIALFSPARFSA